MVAVPSSDDRTSQHADSSILPPLRPRRPTRYAIATLEPEPPAPGGAAVYWWCCTTHGGGVGSGSGGMLAALSAPLR